MAEIFEATNPVDDIRQASKQGVLRGLAGLDAPKPRLDIDVLLKTKPNTFNLFALALLDLQKNDGQHDTDPMSYFQLAGIHGLPTSEWDNVKPVDKDGKPIDKFRGYCPHGKVTFPTWHRAYLALYEQALYLKMTDIAERYTGIHREVYRAAVKEFRLPYWDYYRARAERDTYFPGVTLRNGQTMFPYDFAAPMIFTASHVMVRRTPDNKLVRVDNPFYRYPHPGFSKVDDWVGPLDHGVYNNPYTVKNPKSKTDTTGDPEDMNQLINKGRMSFNRNIHNMVNNSDNKWSYEAFATKEVRGGDPASNLEALHDEYHDLLGGGNGKKDKERVTGWMGYVPTAGFDPVFWIHHCQIDRFTAIWQAANPDKWAESEAGKTALAADSRPFRKSRLAKEEFWNGNDAQKTQKYGYIYEDANGPGLKSPKDVKEKFEALYKWSLPREHRMQIGKPPPSMVPLDLSNAQVYDYGGEEIPRLPEGPGPVVGEAPQYVMSSMQSTAALESDASNDSTSNVSYVKEPDRAAQAVDTTPLQPGDNISRHTWTNPTDMTETAPSSVDESQYYRDWYLDNAVERLAFNGPFSIYYFIGKFDNNDVADYRRQPTLAGSTYVFTSSVELCDNCGILGDRHQVVSDTSSITPLLLDYIGQGLTDLSPANVVPFLIQNLKWRIVSADGALRDPRTTPGFKVGVSSVLEPKDRDGTSGYVYEDYPQVVEQIINRASANPTPRVE